MSCVNQDKGGTAKKACSVACIGCSLCLKECKYDAITIENFLSYIDPKKCVLCRKCVSVCPTDAIWEVNFKPRKPKVEKPSKTIAGKEEGGVNLVAQAQEKNSQAVESVATSKGKGSENLKNKSEK